VSARKIKMMKKTPNWPPSKREMAARQRAAAKAFAEYIAMVKSPRGCRLCREDLKFVDVKSTPATPLKQAFRFEDPDRSVTAGREWIEVKNKKDYLGEAACRVLARIERKRRGAKLYVLMPDEHFDEDRELKGFIIATEWSAELYDARGEFVTLFKITPPDDRCPHDPANWPWHLVDERITRAMIEEALK